jgi:uncharacterized protein YndB with AHSA1/START domain
MEQVVTSVVISRTPDEVFEYVSTPANWPKWHPSSLGVTGAIDHSLEIGEACTEAYRVAGSEGSCVWTVIERDPGKYWKIAGKVIGRPSAGTVAYRIGPHEEGTFFEREFDYDTPTAGLTEEQQKAARKMIEAESREAVTNLKAVLEAS